jgi:hypothetical protein
VTKPETTDAPENLIASSDLLRAHEDGVTLVADRMMSEIQRAHIVLDHASVPRTGLDQRVLSLEQRIAILAHWFRKGR